MLVSPATLGPASDRPATRLSAQNRTGNHALVLRVLRTDEARQRNPFRNTASVDGEETMNLGFTAAGIERDPIKTVAQAAPVWAKDPVQPESGAGRRLRIR